MVDRVKVEVNAAPFNAGDNNDAYVGFFNALLNYKRGVKKNLLRNLQWLKDTEGRMKILILSQSVVKTTACSIAIVSLNADERLKWTRVKQEIFYLSQFVLPGVHSKENHGALTCF